MTRQLHMHIKSYWNEYTSCLIPKDELFCRVIYPCFTLQFCCHAALPRGKLPNVLLFAMKLYLFLRSSCAHSCPTWPSACPWAGFDALMNGQLPTHCTDAVLSYRMTHFWRSTLGLSTVKHSQKCLVHHFVSQMSQCEWSVAIKYVCRAG